MSYSKFPPILSGLFFLLLISQCQLFAQTDYTKDTLLLGSWIGQIDLNGMQFNAVFRVSTDKEGNFTALMDSPDQGVKDIRVDSIKINGTHARFAINKLGGFYEGEILRDSLKITGNWNQAGMTFPLTLRKTEKLAVQTRPQEPKRPFPYKEEEVTVKNEKENILLAGTLTIPQGSSPFPAVVLITGSGAQNRDEELFGHKPFLVISDYLTRNGFVVLRMDDRGVGKSKGNFATATSYNFANDIFSAVEYLKTRPEIDKKKIGLVGHSEGGMIAPMVASQSADVAYIVLLAGVGVPGDELLLLQTELISRAGGMGEKVIQKEQMLAKGIYNVIKRNLDSASTFQSIKAVQKEYMDNLSDEEKAYPENQPKYLDKQIETLVSPWFMAFIRYNPAPVLEKVKCPVLALNGSNDLQVAPSQNLPAIKAALTKGGNKNFETIEIPNLNHLFQTCTPATSMLYGKNEETFSPEVLKIMTDWLQKTVKGIN